MTASFGGWLKQGRKAHGWSQQELAQRVGCSAVLIRKIEANERRPSREVALLIIQQVSLAEEDRDDLLRLARTPLHRLDSAANDPATIEPLSPLTERERDILNLIQADLADSTIAERLSLKISTVRWYVKQIYSKLGVHSRDELIQFDRQLPEVYMADITPHEGVRHNLPAPTTSLVGRRREIETLCTLLMQPSVRLLTLVGTAGIGKTRLSLETAATLRPQFPDGVYFVALAALRDAALVANAIAQELGVSEVSGESILEALKYYLREKQLLLVLDNFEHLLEAAPLVAELLTTAAKVKILATSRERLHIYGEHEYPVPPLTVPDTTSADQVNELADNDCVSLFVQRARAVKSDFRLTQHNARSLAAICIHLDGLPLAIELAAARVKMITPAELEQRLHQKLSTLTGGARDLPQRHQTLRAALAWSYDLLSSHEQTLFARLGIFVGGWSLEAMTAICGARLPMDVYDGLESLLNKSLVQPMKTDGSQPRFTMLETMREYALEKLDELSEAAAVRNRHAQFFLEMVERAEPLLRTAERAFWITQLRAEDGNIRSILSTFSEHDRGDNTALRMAAALWPYWSIDNRHNEGVHWLAGLRDHATDAAPVLRARLLHALAVLETYVTIYSHSIEHFQEALELARNAGDLWICAHILAWYGRINIQQDSTQQEQWLDESLRLARMQQDPWLITTVLTCLGSFYRQVAQYDLSRQVLTEALQLAEPAGLIMEAGIALGEMGETVAAEGSLDEAKSLMMDGIIRLQETGNRVIVAHSLGDMGDVQRLRGDYESAHRLFEEALAFWQEFGSPIRETRLLCKLGFIAFHQGRFEQSETLFRDSLEQTQQHDDRKDVTRNVALGLIGLAKIAFWRKNFLRAIILVGAAHTQLQSIQLTFANLTPADRNEAETLIPLLRQLVDDATYDRHFEDGKQMTLDQAVAYAINS